MKQATIAKTDEQLQKCGCRSLTGEEFKQVAKEVTPLSKIKAPFPKAIPSPHGPEQVGACGRRNESNNKLR